MAFKKPSEIKRQSYIELKRKKTYGSYHPETCPPNCPKCIALQGDQEYIYKPELDVRTQTERIRHRGHLIACAVYDKPQGACNCGKVKHNANS